MGCQTEVDGPKSKQIFSRKLCGHPREYFCFFSSGVIPTFSCIYASAIRLNLVKYRCPKKKK